MTNILCFGDSNTFGTNPAGGRFDIHERWTGILQDALGSDVHIIEEGLGGRTTAMEDSIEQDKNGLRHLPVALQSHRPLDLVILMLGTNDMKHRFNLLPEEIALGAAELGMLVTDYNYGPGYPVPKVLLVSPIHLGEGIEKGPIPGFSADAVEVSKKLAPCYAAMAERFRWAFFDAAAVASPSREDHLHMDLESHKRLGEALVPVVKSLITPDREM